MMDLTNWIILIIGNIGGALSYWFLHTMRHTCTKIERGPL